MSAIVTWDSFVADAFAVCPPAFLPSISYPAGVSPAAVVAGDVNGDDAVDLVVASSGTGSTVVSVLLGNGDGTFQPASSFAAGNRPNGVALGDLNGDGILDIVASNSGLGGNTVSTLVGFGNGAFSSPETQAAAAGPMCPAIADLNADGKSDVVVAANGGNKVSVLLGIGDGTLMPAVNYNVGIFPQCVTVGDLNGDGIPDLAASNSGSGDVSVLLGIGDGTFAAAVNYPAGTVTRAVLTLDANNDGVLDLAAVNDTAAGTIQLLLGNGDGTFQAAIPFTTGHAPVYVAAGDVNGDGHEDLATANFSPGTISILRASSAAFLAPLNFNVSDRPKWIAVADFSGDGRNDLAVVDDDGVSVLINSGPSVGMTQQPADQTLTVGQSVSIGAMADGMGPLTFQWRKAGINLIDGGRIAGSKTPTLSITGAIESDTAAYDVVIRGGCNGAIPTVSRPAALCVNPAPPCQGDFNNDSQFNAADIQAIVDALLAGDTCP